MGPSHFEYLRAMLKERTGLVLTPEKGYLLEARLLPVAGIFGYDSIADLVDALKITHDERLAVAISEAMNTHESFFFRDNSPFDLFRADILPQLLQRRAHKKSFRIWCAACSSGQEPYSLAMILHEEARKLDGWRPEIVATDISHAVLSLAREGMFSQFEVQRGLPAPKLAQHFTQEGEKWRINQNIRKMVRFQHFNLLGNAQGMGEFDVVFCRNVLIYFDLKTKGDVLDGVSSVLAKDGVLFLGSSESTFGITDKFMPIQAGRGIYKHINGAASIAEAV